MIGLTCSAIFATTAFADDSSNIFGIYEQFVVSSAAASRCIKPTPADLEKFTANLMLVGKLVGQELERRNPQATKEQLLSTMNQRSNDLTTKTYDLVKERGCEDKDVQQAIKRFHAQVDWKPELIAQPAAADKPGTGKPGGAAKPAEPAK